ncbi:hypothetical protein EDB80DRAFT_892223 [Ilyonectria destructans]|nr:hypothetical protein EDB80DRAFT_892223 [Ilyonectria destructans]
MDEKKDTDDRYVQFTIPLEYDDYDQSLLGSRTHKNSAGYQSQPRKEVTSYDSAGYGLEVRCRRPRYGTSKNEAKEDVSAALVVLDFSFQPRYSDSTVRFKRAEITFDFDDADTVDHNPHDGMLDPTHQLEVLHWEPRTFQSPATQIVGQKSAQIGLSVEGPSGVGKAGVQTNETKPIIRESAFSIHAVKMGDPGSLIRWTIREDNIRKSGLPPELSLGVICSCTPGRKFVARIRVEATIRLSLLQLSRVAGEKDDPLCFTYPEGQVEAPLQEELETLKILKKDFINKVGLRAVSSGVEVLE